MLEVSERFMLNYALNSSSRSGSGRSSNDSDSGALSWRQLQVPVGDGNFINTVIVSRQPDPTRPNNNDDNNDDDHDEEEVQAHQDQRHQRRGRRGRRKLVLVHGWCGAIAYWVRNFEGLLLSDDDAYDDVYAVDLLGWGRSSRPNVDQRTYVRPFGPFVHQLLEQTMDVYDVSIRFIIHSCCSNNCQISRMY